MGHNSAYFHLWQVSKRFHSSVICISFMKHDFRNSPSAFALQCDINETVILISARLMKSHGFLASISFDKVHHTVMILSFIMWVIITSTLMFAFQKGSEVHLGIYCKYVPSSTSNTERLAHSADKTKFPSGMIILTNKYTNFIVSNLFCGWAKWGWQRSMFSKWEVQLEAIPWPRSSNT